jgi:hypothetical protein
MGARQKLNMAFVNGCALVAAVAGYGCGSWIVFALAMAVVVVLALQTGDIRLKPVKRH